MNIAVHPKLPCIELEIIFCLHTQLAEQFSTKFEMFHRSAVAIHTVDVSTNRTWFCVCFSIRATRTIAVFFVVIFVERANGTHD
jgi:hypothetical protein